MNPIEILEPPSVTPILIEIVLPSMLNISSTSSFSTNNIFNEFQIYLPNICLQTCMIVSSIRIYHNIHCPNFVCPECMTEGGTHAVGYTREHGDGEDFICQPMYCVHSLQCMKHCMIIPGMDPQMAWHSPECHFRPRTKRCPEGCDQICRHTVVVTAEFLRSFD